MVHYNFYVDNQPKKPQNIVEIRATLSVALYARQMQFTWDHIHYLKVRQYQNVKSIRQVVFLDIAFTNNILHRVQC